MDKYIIELLKEESTVIIPGLGALMNGAKEGTYIFNKYLKINDHKLEDYISKTDGVDKQEAGNRVAKMVREINARLDKGETYDIFELGRFFKDEDGTIEFDSWEKVKSFSSALASKTETKKEEPKKEEPKKEAPKETKPTPKKEEPKAAEKPKAEAKPTAKATDKAHAKKEEKEASKVKAPSKADSTKKAEETKPAPKVADKSVDIKKEAVKPKNVIEPKAEEKKEEKTNPLEHKAIEPKSAIKPKEEPKKAEAAAGKSEIKPDPKAKEAAKAPVKDAKQKALEEKERKAKAAEEKKKAAEAKKKKAEEAKKLKAEKKKNGQKESGGNKALKIVLIFLVIIVLGGGGFTIFKWDMVKGWIGMEQVAEESDEKNEGDVADVNADHDTHEEVVNEDDTTATESTEEVTETEATEETTEETTEEVVEETPVKEEEPVVEETPVKTVTSAGAYHIIVGGFSDGGNASRLVSQLQAKGYPAQDLGRYSGLNLVSIKSFDSMSSAKSELGTIGSEFNGAWIFKKK